MKRILILFAISLFLCSTVNAFQGGGGESTKKKASPKKTSGTKPNITTPPRPPAPPARPKTPTVANLMVNSNLPSVTVTINGSTAGTTDSNGYLLLGSLKPGAYTVSVAKPGYQPDKIDLNLSAGQSETLNFELKPITQGLNISSTPPECEVYVDDVLRGRTDSSGNVKFADVPVGEHRVAIRKSRYREAIFPLSLSSDKEGQINATLELAVGFLTVTTNAPNPSIDISGVGHFDKPVSKFECQPGTYTVTISSPLYVTSRKEVSVSAGQEAEVSVTLEADSEARSRLASRLPTFGQKGRPVEILGPFDGNYTNTSVKVGGNQVKILSESAEKIVFEAPDSAGPSKITLREGQVEVKGAYRNVRVNLSAPKTNLLKGGRTTLTIAVEGLQGIQREVTLKLEISGVVSFLEGDTGTIAIQPQNVDSGGRFELKRTVIANSVGNWSVTATVLNAP